MSKGDNKDLRKFLKPYPPGVRTLALWVREFVWDLYPAATELIYDNYNALALGWSLSDRLGDCFCSIAVLPRYIHFGFFRGNEILDPKKILLGKGNQYRYIILEKASDLPKTYIRILLREAYSKARARKSLTASKKGSATVIKGFWEGKTIVKSISPVKKRPV
jgi:hypothetical protein